MSARNGSSERTLDAEILHLLKSRDREFLQRLFGEVNPYLQRICVANGIIREEIHELIHQTWEQFFFNLDKFEGRSQIRTFICGILFNKIREYRRFQKRFVPEEDPQKFMDDAFTPDGWWKTEPSDPHKMVEMKQISSFIKECLEGLSDQQMAAFVLREVENEDSNDICLTMGVNVSHLRVLLFRAKEKLRKCLEGKMSWEEA